MSIVKPGSGLTLNRGNRHQRRTVVRPPFPIEGSSSGALTALAMVHDLPNLFTLVFETEPKGPGPSGAVYRFDIEKAKSFLGEQAQTGKPTDG
jgi:hypothetical protein